MIGGFYGLGAKWFGANVFEKSLKFGKWTLSGGRIGSGLAGGALALGYSYGYSYMVTDQVLSDLASVSA